METWVREKEWAVNAVDKWIVVSPRSCSRSWVHFIDSEKEYDVVNTTTGKIIRTDGKHILTLIKKDPSRAKRRFPNVDTTKMPVQFVDIYPYWSSDEFAFGKDSSFSNFYICKVVFDGREYTSSEAAYQSMKTLNPKIRDKFVGLSPVDAKKLGRQIQDSSELRPDWWSVQKSVMWDVLKAKYSQNKNCMLDMNFVTGYRMVENTTGWHDNIWGTCYCEKCRGEGNNWLGKMLTQLRIEALGR